MVLVEEHIIKTQMHISSAYAGAMLPTLTDWLQRLQRLQTTIEAYVKCRTKHGYLAPLFSAGK